MVGYPKVYICSWAGWSNPIFCSRLGENQNLCQDNFKFEFGQIQDLNQDCIFFTGLLPIGRIYYFRVSYYMCRRDTRYELGFQTGLEGFEIKGRFNLLSTITVRAILHLYDSSSWSFKTFQFPSFSIWPQFNSLVIFKKSAVYFVGLWEYWCWINSPLINTIKARWKVLKKNPLYTQIHYSAGRKLKYKFLQSII